MMEPKTIDKRLFDYPAGPYCGLLIDETTMKRLAKIQNRYQSEVRKILTDSRESLYSSFWTLANRMDGGKILRQVTVKYALESTEEWESVERRIALFVPQQPIYCDEVFLVKSHDEAKEIAELKLRELSDA